MVGRIERVQYPRTSATTNEESLALWYELGCLRAVGRRRAACHQTGLYGRLCRRGAGVALGARVRHGLDRTFRRRYTRGGRIALRRRVVPGAAVEAAAARRRSAKAARGARPRRRSPGAGRPRHLLRRAARLAEKRVRVFAGAGRQRERPTLREIFRLYTGGLVRDRAFEHGSRFAGDADPAGAVGT